MAGEHDEHMGQAWRKDGVIVRAIIARANTAASNPPQS